MGGYVIKKANCPVCKVKFVVKADGTMRWHLGDTYQGRWRQICKGVGQVPVGTSEVTDGR